VLLFYVFLSYHYQVGLRIIVGFLSDLINNFVFAGASNLVTYGLNLVFFSQFCESYRVKFYCKIIVDRPRRLKVDVYSERFTSQSKHGPCSTSFG
jgi:hypothetical protein